MSENEQTTRGEVRGVHRSQAMCGLTGPNKDLGLQKYRGKLLETLKQRSNMIYVLKSFWLLHGEWFIVERQEEKQGEQGGD